LHFQFYLQVVAQIQIAQKKFSFI